MISSWDRRFMRLADEISSWSKDPRKKIGCLIVDADRNPVATGFNGFPRGMCDDERLQDQTLKRRIIMHAEANAIITAGRPRCLGCTLYVSMQPCCTCAGAIIQAGIARVVYRLRVSTSTHWDESFALALEMFSETGVVCDSIGDLCQT